MGSTDNGSQSIYIKYKPDATTEEFGKKDTKILKPGIYDGGELAIDSGDDILIDPLVALCETSGGQVIRVITADYAELTLDEATPYACLTYVWSNNLIWYADFSAKDSGSITSMDIILGEGVYVASTLSSFDYTEKTWGLLDADYNVLARNGFVLHQTDTAPSSPYNGQMYFDSSTDILYIYNGSIWMSSQFV